MLDRLRFARALMIGVAAALLVLVAVAPEGSCIHALIRGDVATPGGGGCGRFR